jgi:CheY-like chemotaxis protein
MAGDGEGKIDVLVVDEEEDMLELTETFLRRESGRIAVTTERDPTAAATRAVEEGFDCVVTDLRMPRIDGIELCERVHDRQPELPCFLFTAADRETVDTRTNGDELAGVVRKGTGTDHYGELAALIEDAVSG